MQKSRKDETLLFKLPLGWELVDQLRESVDLKGAKVQIAGMAAKLQSTEAIVTGSAASWTQDPEALAYFELLERIAIVEAIDRQKQQPGAKIWRLIDPQRGGSRGEALDIFASSPEPLVWQPAKSNGVALGSSWQHASHNAICEAVERHLLLASWYGASVPEKIEGLGLPPALSALGRSYKIENYSFGALSTSVGRAAVHVSGTFFWPLKAGSPAIYGFGGAFSRSDALQKSLREAVQRLSFLEDSEASASEPEFSPTPDYHQEFYLHPQRQEILRKWLKGAFYTGQEAEHLISLRNPVQFVDLTPPNFEQLVVVKAVTPSLLPLWFGRFKDPRCPEVESERSIHPLV